MGKSLEEILTSPIIKGARATYHLVTEERLNNLIVHSFFGDLFFAFFSIFMGVALTVENGLTFAILGFFSFFVSLVFYYLKFKSIRKAKKSGALESFKKSASTSGRLEIVKAIYGNPPDHTTDVTNKLRREIQNNKLSVRITNEFVESDPHRGVRKALEIQYKYGGKTFSKRFSESSIVDLP